MGIKALLVLWLIPSAAVADLAVQWSKIAWDGSVGGISAIEVAPDGRSFVALSDRSWIIEGAFKRDAEGRLNAVIHTAPIPLRVNGRAIDSEGLAIAPDGSLYVSSERPHGIFHLQRNGHLIAHHTEPDFAGWVARNQGLEALAMGRGLIALPERAGMRVPIWAEDQGAWSQISTLDLPIGFAPVGADMGPDDRLYVLMRAIKGFGFANIVVRIDLATGHSQQVVSAPSGQHGNLEGISVWQAPDGAIMITIVTDDNKNPFQSSDVVEYRVHGD